MAGHEVSVTAETAPTRQRFRPEIEGLRGLAAALVVVYHVWVGRVSGGVDVFFLLSGFLVIGLLARAAIRGETAGLGRTWRRLFSRLIPTAGLVLLVSTVATMLVVPASRWAQNGRELLASVFFMENWRLAADSVDYYADNSGASVAQHFWSLSIQGQFYVAAPLLVLVVAGLARSRGVDVRQALLASLVGLAAVSFAYSVVATATDQPFAYFDARARVWEFALGGILALVVDGVRLSRRVRVGLGWAGVTGLAACGAVLDVGSGFPGYLALWPVAAAAAVIVAGDAGGGADRMLVSRPLRYLGAISYPLYLWHWPVLIVFLVHTGEPRAGLGGGLGVVAVSFLLAVATHHLVEEPARRLAVDRVEGPGRAWVLVVLPLVPVLVVLGLWSAATVARAAPPVVPGDPDHPGALALTPGFVYEGQADPPLQPSMATVRDDWAEYRNGCAPVADHPNLEQCVPLAAAGVPDRRITLVGDSHMQQFLPALEPLARERNWEIRTLVRARCPFSTSSDTDPEDSTCVDWNAAAVEHLAADPPDAVVVAASRDVRRGLTEQTPRGFVEAWQRLDSLGLPVVAVRDNPRFDHQPSECIEANGRGAEACDVPRAELLAADPPYTYAEGVPADVMFLDLSNDICTSTACPPEIGNVAVYLDDNHLSASYSRTLSTIVSREIPARLGW